MRPRFEVGEVLVERVVAPEKTDVVTVVDGLVDERPVALFEELLEEGVVRLSSKRGRLPTRTSAVTGKYRGWLFLALEMR
jgi:hypothetical protein